VLFVGAMGDHRKGFDTLYEAWKQLVAESSWDSRLVVVGAGASLGAWQARAVAEGLSKSIEFLGFRKDVESVMAASDILVSPARYEAYGLNVHEALCRGLPALASRDSGVAEQFPESLAELLIPDPNDSADLAGRLRNWRSKPESLRAATSPVAERLRLRSWGVVAREFVEAIESG
jgi:glycosyltransferase involved in cell wall biosynthesis